MGMRDTSTSSDTDKEPQEMANGSVTRKEVLDLSADLFAKHGYRSTSLEVVADQLGVTRQALYYHFRNKGEILSALFEQMMTRLETAVSAAAAEDGDDVFLAMLRAHIETAVENSDLVALLLHERPEIAKLPDVRAGKRRREYAAMFLSAYEDGVRAGRFRAVDPHVAVNTLISGANGISWWYHGDRSLDRRSIAEAVFQLLTTGFYVADSSGRKAPRRSSPAPRSAAAASVAGG
jgi:AcrR family transcriptional regulator